MQSVNAEWAIKVDVHKYVTGAELSGLCWSRNTDKYHPIQRTALKAPEALIEKVAYLRTICPPGHEPRDGDWNCRFCNRFNFWDHAICAGCNRAKSLLELSAGSLKEALVDFYMQASSLECGIDTTDAELLDRSPKVPLISRKVLRERGLTAGMPPAMHQFQPVDMLDGAKGGKGPIVAGSGGKGRKGIGASKREPVAGDGLPADPYARFRHRSSKKYIEEICENRVMRRSGQAPGGGRACFKCGIDGHKASDCRMMI
ncbi:hypothetical protein DIPPA_08295 [Diplonema papillatum]|nr:hypothetical protein DIPPA_08295 [Diplonema papillatum]